MPRIRSAFLCVLAVTGILFGEWEPGGRDPAKADDQAEPPGRIVELQNKNKTIVVRKARGKEKPSDSLSDVCRSTPYAEFVFYQGCPVTDDDVASLFLLIKLRKATLCGSGVGEASIKQIARLLELRELRVAQLWVTDEGLDHLKPLKNLESLTVFCKDISDKGIASIASLTKLRELRLGGETITDERLKQLHGLKNLDRLMLMGTKVTDAGVAQFQQALPQCEITR